MQIPKKYNSNSLYYRIFAGPSPDFLRTLVEKIRTRSDENPAEV
ncbi:hypothetical protein [Sphingobacterium cellulitidis]|nr:hypothetical protein [Sphingobacterium soli]MBA8986850.1 hypothetical protein [Sphingobacterium soli]